MNPYSLDSELSAKLIIHSKSRHADPGHLVTGTPRRDTQNTRSYLAISISTWSSKYGTPELSYGTCFYYIGCLFHYTRCLCLYMRCFLHYIRCLLHYIRCFLHYIRCFLQYDRHQSFFKAVSIKHGLRTTDYELRTGYKTRTGYRTRTQYKPRTEYYGLSINTKKGSTLNKFLHERFYKWKLLISRKSPFIQV